MEKEVEIMYILVEFAPRNKRKITRTEIIEVPEIKTKSLTVLESASCYNKAISLCSKDERVFGWKLLEEYELNKETWGKSAKVTTKSGDELEITLGDIEIKDLNK